MDSLPNASKRCTRCGEPFPLDAEHFRPRTDRPGRYISWCRGCEQDHQRKRYAGNPEAGARASRNYRAAHPERVADSQRRYRNAFPEKLSAHQRDYAARHAEEARARVRQWDREHPGEARMRQRNRKARRRQRPGTFSPWAWERLKAQFNWTCLCCGRREPDIKLEPDHVIPLALGGWNIISNIAPLCGPCNNIKGATFRDYRPLSFWA